MRIIFLRGLLTVAIFTFCTSQDFDPTVCMNLPDETKIPSPFWCNQFYVCENGMLSTEGTCPQNLLFNPDTKDCEFADTVDCRGVPLPPGFETTELTTQDTGTEEPTTISSRCPAIDPEDPIFLPTNDCRSYVICFHGKEKNMKCPGDFCWNSEISECDICSNVQCLENNEFGCPRVGVVFLSHPDTCKKYIYCRDGYSRVQSCGFFKVFDVEQTTCVFGNSCE